MSVSDTWVLPLTELFNGDTRQALVRAAVEELDDDAEYTKSDLARSLDLTANRVLEHIKPLVAYGVYEKREAQIPHYRVADTDVVGMLRAWDGYPLWELCSAQGARDLVDFFLTQAENDTSYSKNALSEQASVNYRTVGNYIDTLVESGLVERVEGTRATEYTLATDSEILAYCYSLNELLAETYDERTTQ